MNGSTLTKLWSGIALLALYSAFNGIADMQGSAFLLPFVLEISDARGPAAKAIFWFLLAALPYLLALYLAHWHIRRYAAQSALAAWPVMFGLDLVMNDPLARRYQWFWLLLLLSVPLYACGFLLNEVFELQVFQRKQESMVLAQGWIEHLTTFRFGHDYRVRSAERGGPVSYYPGLQPAAFLLLLIGILYHWLHTVAALLSLRRHAIDAHVS
jgi:hypothetical protein